MLLPVCEDQLVDIAVKGTIRQTGQLIDARKVVVLFFVPSTKSREVVVTVRSSQDASATRVEPVTWILFGMALDQASSDSVGGADMV